jgi:hypothetical protein
MKALIPLPPLPTYLDRYIAIRDKKHSATRVPLVAEHALLTQRYLDYAQAIALNALSGLVQSPSAMKLSTPLRACYGSTTQPLKDLKKAIVDTQHKRQLKYCPMCGTTLPKTYDHYLPAVYFPEYAVHPQNLVPCCGTCNSIKGDDWLCAAGGRQYLHAYSDVLPNTQIVHVKLHQLPALKGVGATFSLLRPTGIPQAQWRLIDSHFRRLHLLDRYDELGNIEIAEILSDSKTYQDEGGPDVRAFLFGRATDRCGVYGRNHWTTTLMRALAQHQDLQSWIDSA